MFSPLFKVVVYCIVQNSGRIKLFKCLIATLENMGKIVANEIEILFCQICPSFPHQNFALYRIIHTSIHCELFYRTEVTIWSYCIYY